MTTSPPKSKQAFSWRLIYAFVIVWLAGFAILSPLVRRGAATYRSTAVLKFELNQDRAVTPDDLLALLRSGVGRITQPQTIEQICRIVSKPANPNTAIAEVNAEAILRQLRIAHVNENGQLSLAVSLDGRGSSDEREFVNHLANGLAIEVPRQSDQCELQQWIKTTTDSLDMSKQVHLAEQIRAEVAEANAAIGNLKQRFELNDLSAITAQIDILEDRKSRLKHEPGLDDSHPEIVQLQTQVEALRSQLLQNKDFRPVQVGTTVPSEPSNLIKNRYYQASLTTTKSVPTEIEFTAALDAIDLSEIGSAATQLKSNAESISDMQNDINAAVVDGYPSGTRLLASLRDVNYSTRPVFLGSGKPTPTWLILVPCLIAALVALHYNAIRDRMHLKSLDDVAKAMGIGIIGEMPSTQTIAAPAIAERYSATAVRLAEYSLLAVGGLLLASCVMRPQIMSVIISNPLVAVSNWFWLIVG